MSELKPCPLCGGEADYDEAFDTPSISCCDCGFPMITNDNKEWVIEKWNTRHDKTAEIIAMLEETIQTESQLFEEEQDEDVRQSFSASLASLQIALIRAKAIRDREVSEPHPMSLTPQTMKLCQKCGNERCPHTKNVAYVCTNSNEPNQAEVIE